LTKNNTININLKYTTNFNPNFLIKPQNLNKNYKSLDKINCKNFILFILLLKYVFKKETVSIFVKPKKSSIYNILRAPYKNKMARHQITFSRFFFNISIRIKNSSNLVFINIKSLIIFLNFLKNFYSFFESNICFQHKSILIFNFQLNDFFLL